jgi:ABC-type uncharacterized transport system permease subunit
VTTLRRASAWIYAVAGIAVAMLLGAILLTVTGYAAGPAFSRLFQDAFGSSDSLAQTAVQAVPILLSGVGIAFAARMGLWNIGAEGQFYMGALAAVGIFQYFPDLPSGLMLSCMAIAGAAAGALWILAPALLRAKLGVSEILTTLMLNYVAVPISNYFLYGPWKSPTAFNFPVTRVLTGNARLPQIPGFPVHIGFPIALAGAAILYFVFSRTSWGFQVRVIGDNRRAAEYLGYPIARLTVQVLCLSGALAGFAGMLHVAGVTHQMLPNLSPGYGYTGIIVASLALLDILATTVVSFLLAGLIVGSQSVQNTGVPGGLSFFLQGLVLLMALAAVALASRRQARRRRIVRGQKEGLAPA